MIPPDRATMNLRASDVGRTASTKVASVPRPVADNVAISVIS